MSCPTILLAEDNPEIRQEVVSLLQSQFEIVASVTDGQEAINSALALAPDIVLLDISMPALNGMQVTSRLNDLGSRSKVIFLTVHEDRDYVEAAFRLGAFGYVLKGRINSDLATAVEQALEGRRFVSPFPVRRRRDGGEMAKGVFNSSGRSSLP
jgi:DNA-binding NarL/FixJ family response regulator